MSHQDQPVIDEQALATLKAALGDDAVVRQLIALYIQDSPAQITSGKTALAAGDGVTLARAAHSLKSTSASIGAMRVLAIAKDLEAQAKGGDLVQSATLLRALETELNNATAVLQQKLA